MQGKSISPCVVTVTIGRCVFADSQDISYIIFKMNTYISKHTHHNGESFSLHIPRRMLTKGW